MKSSTIRLHSCLFACASLSPLLALAQEVALQEVVVTAQKRVEREIDVPMTMAVVDGEELQQRGVESLQDLSLAVPGVTTREDGPGSYTIFMRGVSNDYGTGALVGAYLDEVPITLTGYDQLDVRVMDLERVEVLKGPQGTLYGQGSEAGTIRYITKDPVLNQYQGLVDATLATIDGGAGQQTATVVANLPLLQDVLGVRLAGHIEHGGGWQDQPAAGIYNGNYQDLKNFRAKMLWTPLGGLKIKAMLISHSNESKLGNGYENPDRTVYVAINPAIQLIPKSYRYDLYNLDVTYDFAGAQLTSSTSEINLIHHYPNSYLGGAQTIYEDTLSGNGARRVDDRQFSQELRLSSTGTGPLKWTFGGFYRSTHREYFERYDTEVSGTIYPDSVYTETEGYNSYSLFADLSYDLTSRLTVGAGTRYFEDRQAYTDNSGTPEKWAQFHSTDPRGYASYKITSRMNAYATVSKGFRSGGFNYGALPGYGPESLVNYELGLKGNTENGRFAYDISGYYSDYSNMLRRGLVLIPSTGVLQQLVSNIGTVHVKGVDAGVTWRATSQLTLSASGSWTSSVIVAVNAQDATNIAGDPVDYVPKFAYTGSANYTFNWWTNLPGHVRLDFMHRDRVYYTDRSSFPAANLPQSSDPLNLLNGRIGVTWGKTVVDIYGTNLTNENRWVDPEHAWDNANRTRPRLVGLEGSYQF